MSNTRLSEKFFAKILELRWYVLLVFGLISLYGFYSLKHIKIDAIPDITNKQVIINTQTFGMDPSNVEKAITFPIESEMFGIEGLKEMRSISKLGLSQIILIFEDNIDVYFARNLVMQRLTAVQDQLPPEVAPALGPLTTGIGEIIFYRLYDKSGESDLTKIRALQEYKISRHLKKIPGIAEVDTIGGYERQLHLNVDPNKITQYGLTPDRVIMQLQSIGENFGGGYIEQDDRQKIVRTFANLDNYNEIMDIGVKIDYTGRSLPLRHIVEIRQEHSQRLGVATYKGEEAVIGTVMLQSKANAREALIKVKEEIDKFNSESPDIQIEILYDRQFLIDATIKTVLKNLCEGILLVVGVLCLMLGNLRVGLIVASTLLFCIVILAACMRLFNISANLMSLGAIDFGLLVDSSVVLIEYLLVHLFVNSDENKEKRIAKLCADVVKPITLGIVIIVLVYLPILLFEGIEGKTFKPMAINVIIAMSASLLVAFFMMPILAFFFIKKSAHHGSKIFDKLLQTYSKILNIVLHRSKFVMTCCAGFFVSSIVIFFFMSSDFLPQLNEGDLVFTVLTKEGTSLTATRDILADIEQKIVDEKKIEKTFVRIGSSQSGLDPMPQNAGDLVVIPKAKYKTKALEIADEIFDKIRKICDTCNVVQTQPIAGRFNEMLEGSRADLSLRIFGPELKELLKITDQIIALLGKKPVVKTMEKDFVTSIRQGTFIDVIPDYDLIARNQISLLDLNKNLRNSMAGIKIGTFYTLEFPISIILHVDEEKRHEMNTLKQIPIGLSDGGSIKLSQVSDIEEHEDIVSIPRIYGRRYSGISIYLKGTDYDGFIKKAEAEIAAKKILPEGYQLKWGGRFKNFNNAKKRILTIIPFVILAIVVLLFKMFNDWRKVAVIFSSVPFALSGAILLLAACHIPITISVYIGFIALIGISLLNSIILIDTYRSRADLKEACLSRFRPIIMTALVASLGFLPMAFGHGIGAEVQQPLAITVIGGIISSTIATLILSPVLLQKMKR